MPTMTDPALICPKCGESIALTESLAAPLVAATRAQYERQLATQAEAFADQKKTVAAQQAANERRASELEASARKQRQEVAQAVEDQVAAKLATERKTIAEQETARARRQMNEELRPNATPPRNRRNGYKLSRANSASLKLRKPAF